MRFAALSLALLLLGVSYSAAMAHPHTASLVGSRFARCGLCRSAAVKCCDGEMDGVVDGDEDPVVRSCTPMRSHFVVSGTGQPLPERFEMKVLALQGKFSPEDGAADTEHSDDLLLDGLVGFPADVPVRVVTRNTSEDEQAALVSQVSEICKSAAGVEPTKLEVKPRLGGKVASINFSVLVSSSDSLSVVREKLRSNPHVRMVF